MRADIEDRCRKLGMYICSTKETIRAAAKVWGISKSTCHKDLVERLPEVDPVTAEKVKKILAYHKAQRHILGGKATAEIWRRKRGFEQK